MERLAPLFWVACYRAAIMGKTLKKVIDRRSVVKVWVTPVESSMISSDGITLHPKLIGMSGGDTGPEPGFAIGLVDSVRTTARICARAPTAVDGTGGLNTNEAAFAGEMLVTTSCFSKAPVS